MHLPLEDATGDGAPVVYLFFEDAVKDEPLIVGGGIVVHRFLEGATGDSAGIVSPTANGAVGKVGVLVDDQLYPLQGAFSPGFRRGLQGTAAIVQLQPTAGTWIVVPIAIVAAVCGLAFGIQLDGKAFGGAVFCVQITAAAGGGFLLGAAGGVGLLHKGGPPFWSWSGQVHRTPGRLPVQTPAAGTAAYCRSAGCLQCVWLS